MYYFTEKRLEQTQTENLLTWEHLRTESYLEDKRMEEENETSTRLYIRYRYLGIAWVETKFLIGTK